MTTPPTTAAEGPRWGGEDEGEEAKEREGEPTGKRPRSNEWCGDSEPGGAGVGRGSSPMLFRDAVALAEVKFMP